MFLARNTPQQFSYLVGKEIPEQSRELEIDQQLILNVKVDYKMI